MVGGQREEIWGGGVVREKQALACAEFTWSPCLWGGLLSLLQPEVFATVFGSDWGFSQCTQLLAEELGRAL